MSPGGATRDEEEPGREWLRVDFDAALDKLALAQLQGAWQWPGELARFALGRGARALELRLGQGRLTLEAPGVELPAATMRDFAAVIDRGATPVVRHAALVRLEGSDALALTALAALARSARGQAEIESSGGGWRFALARHGRPRLVPGSGGTWRLNVRGLTFDERRAVRWLAQNGRFAPVPIRLDGHELRRGFRRSLIRVELGRPLPAVISIAASGEAPRLWLLRHGIIATRATVPGFPAFEAAVEMSSLELSETTAAALREAVQPFLEKWVESAVALMLHLAAEAEKLPEEIRQRVACLLLEAVRCGRRGERARRAPIFPEVGRGTRRLISIADVERLASPPRGDGSLEALAPPRRGEPGVPPRGAFVRPLLVLSAAERALLGEVSGIRFRLAVAGPSPHRPWRRRLAEQAGRVVFLWHRLRGRVLVPAALRDAERALASACATLSGEARAVVFRRGAGRIWLAGNRLLLPRDNATVTLAVAAVERRPDLLYPALVALLDGRASPPPELRERWLTEEDVVE